MSQMLPSVQSAGWRQLVLHAVAPHAYAPHGELVDGVHVPLPSQVCAVVSPPAAQLALGPQDVPGAK